MHTALKKRLAIGLGPAHTSEQRMARYDGFDPAQGPFLRVSGGQSFNGRYDVDTAGIVLWRGDSRGPTGPDGVFQTGLSSRFVRDDIRPEIVWRCEVDDVVPASAVCLVRDIRGAAFFPFPRHADRQDEIWIYAIWVPRAACTYDIQRMADMTETADDPLTPYDWRTHGHFTTLDDYNWRNPARFGYDPTWDNIDNACCVWQFAEYAVHVVRPENILAAWKCNRRFLVQANGDDDRVVAGIQFRLQWLVRPGYGSIQHDDAYNRAQELARPYAEQEYPNHPQLYVSYFGIALVPGAPLPSRASAKNALVSQPRRILTASDADFCMRGMY
jgi:hypothetical protein